MAHHHHYHYNCISWIIIIIASEGLIIIIVKHKVHISEIGNNALETMVELIEENVED